MTSDHEYHAKRRLYASFLHYDKTIAEQVIALLKEADGARRNPGSWAALTDCPT